MVKLKSVLMYGSFVAFGIFVVYAIATKPPLPTPEFREGHIVCLELDPTVRGQVVNVYRRQYIQEYSVRFAHGDRITYKEYELNRCQ